MGKGAAHGAGVFVVALLLTLVVSASAGARGWSLQPMPSTDQNGQPSLPELLGVSCSAIDSCAAVGQVFYLTPSVPLGEAWDGSSWSIYESAIGGDANTPLLGVSCWTGGCMAVGYVTYRGGPQLAMAQLGGVDVPLPYPIYPPPRGEGDALDSVSCVAPGLCTAVGSTNGINFPPVLIERWDGTAWTFQTAAMPSDGGYLKLSGVSCATATSCIAVGGGDAGTAAESWDGTSWSLDATPNPPGSGTLASFSGVSCPSPGDCTAVGTWSTISLVTSGFAEQLRHGRWEPMNVPSPPGATATGLAAVSCPSADTCTAVGGFLDSAGMSHSLAEREHHGRWVVQTTPAVPGATADNLTAVSCPTRGDCEAVGTWVAPSPTPEFGNLTNTLAEQWVGSRHHHNHGRHRPGGWRHGDKHRRVR